MIILFLAVFLAWSLLWWFLFKKVYCWEPEGIKKNSHKHASLLVIFVILFTLAVLTLYQQPLLETLYSEIFQTPLVFVEPYSLSVSLLIVTFFLMFFAGIKVAHFRSSAKKFKRFKILLGMIFVVSSLMLINVLDNYIVITNDGVKINPAFSFFNSTYYNWNMTTGARISFKYERGSGGRFSRDHMYTLMYIKMRDVGIVELSEDFPTYLTERSKERVIGLFEVLQKKHVPITVIPLTSEQKTALLSHFKESIQISVFYVEQEALRISKDMIN